MCVCVSSDGVYVCIYRCDCVWTCLLFRLQDSFHNDNRVRPVYIFVYCTDIRTTFHAGMHPRARTKPLRVSRMSRLWSLRVPNVRAVRTVTVQMCLPESAASKTLAWQELNFDIFLQLYAVSANLWETLIFRLEPAVGTALIEIFMKSSQSFKA